MRRHRFNQFRTFCRYFFRYSLVIGEIILGLFVVICLAGVLFAFVEKRPLGESIYFAFVTGLTIGYGDITPETVLGRILSVLIGVTGMILVGLQVAVATRALADTIKDHEEQFRR